MDILNQKLIAIVDKAIKQINSDIENVWHQSFDKPFLQWPAPTYPDFLYQVDQIIEYSKTTSFVPVQIYIDVSKNYCLVNLYRIDEFEKIQLEDYGEILAMVNDDVFIQIGEQEL